jgi:spore germination cell wall hydrolase CwlJ-like protein
MKSLLKVLFVICTIISGIVVSKAFASVSYMKYNIPLAKDSIYYDKESQCLSTAILKEATGTDYKSKVRVARSILNRANSSSGGNTICSTVYMKRKLSSGRVVCDYSWACSKSKNKHKISFTDRKLSITLASEILEGKHSNITKATHFVHCSVVKKNSSWLKNMKYLGRDEHHCFYMNKPKRK